MLASGNKSFHYYLEILLLALLFLLLINGAGMSHNSPVGFSANTDNLTVKDCTFSQSESPLCAGSFSRLTAHCCPCSLTASQPQPLLAMTQPHDIATPSLPVLQRFCACYATTWSALHPAHSLSLLRSLFQKLSQTNYLLGSPHIV